MAFFRDGYIAKKTNKGIGLKKYKTTFFIKFGKSCPILDIGTRSITFPQEFGGKHIKLKVEIIEECKKTVN